MFKIKMVKSDWAQSEISLRRYRRVAPSFLSKYLFSKIAKRKSARIVWFIARLFGAHVESCNPLAVRDAGGSLTIDSAVGAGAACASMTDDAAFRVAIFNDTGVLSADDSEGVA